MIQKGRNGAFDICSRFVFGMKTLTSKTDLKYCVKGKDSSAMVSKSVKLLWRQRLFASQDEPPLWQRWWMTSLRSSAFLSWAQVSTAFEFCASALNTICAIKEPLSHLIIIHPPWKANLFGDNFTLNVDLNKFFYFSLFGNCYYLKFPPKTECHHTEIHLENGLLILLTISWFCVFLGSVNS